MKGWEDIRTEVLRRIRQRIWAPGGLIPNEEDLATEFGVARATVNRALRDTVDSAGQWRARVAALAPSDTEHDLTAFAGDMCCSAGPETVSVGGRATRSWWKQ